MPRQQSLESFCGKGEGAKDETAEGSQRNSGKKDAFKRRCQETLLNYGGELHAPRPLCKMQ